MNRQWFNQHLPTILIVLLALVLILLYLLFYQQRVHQLEKEKIKQEKTLSLHQQKLIV